MCRFAQDQSHGPQILQQDFRMFVWKINGPSHVKLERIAVKVQLASELTMKRVRLPSSGIDQLSLRPLLVKSGEREGELRGAGGQRRAAPSRVQRRLPPSDLGENQQVHQCSWTVDKARKACPHRTNDARPSLSPGKPRRGASLCGANSHMFLEATGRCLSCTLTDRFAQSNRMEACASHRSFFHVCLGCSRATSLSTC